MTMGHNIASGAIDYLSRTYELPAAPVKWLIFDAIADEQDRFYVELYNLKEIDWFIINYNDRCSTTLHDIRAAITTAQLLHKIAKEKTARSLAQRDADRPEIDRLCTTALIHAEFALENNSAMRDELPRPCGEARSRVNILATRKSR